MVERAESPRGGRPAKSPGVLARLPLAPTLTIALVGLTLVLALIAALSIGTLYSARQDYEDTLARSYEVESSSSRLLAAGVIEETALVAVGPGAPAARARAKRAFGRAAANTLRLARGDRVSVRRVRARAAAQRRVRRLAARARRPGTPAAARLRLARGFDRARGAGDAVTARQRTRRASARDSVRDDTRKALLIAAVAGGLALLGALALIAALISSIRRPLESLVTATQRLAAGDLTERVEPDGPLELRELDAAFNTMADRLEGAQKRDRGRAGEAGGDDREPRRRPGGLRRRRQGDRGEPPRRGDRARAGDRRRRAWPPTVPLPDLEDAIGR